MEETTTGALRTVRNAVVDNPTVEDGGYLLLVNCEIYSNRIGMNCNADGNMFIYNSVFHALAEPTRAEKAIASVLILGFIAAGAAKALRANRVTLTADPFLTPPQNA